MRLRLCLASMKGPLMRRRLLISAAALTLLTFALAGGIGASAADPSAALGHDGVPAFGHVFVIIGENTARGNMSAAVAPYQFGTLKPASAWVNNYWSFPVDGSLANYIGMTSGQYTTCDINNNLPAKCHQRTNNIFHQMDVHNMSWKLWAESATGPCDFFDSGTNWNGNTYGAHHNPAVYYDNITGGSYSEARPPKKECLKNIIPTGTTAPNDTSALDAALASGTGLGQLNIIVPNDCENSHDRCGQGSRYNQFDQFLQREIPKIEASPAFGSDGVIFVTYDEGADPGIPNRFNIQMEVTGPLVQPGVYSGGVRWSHYSLLRTLEDGFGFHYLGGAKTARPLGNIWK